MRNCRLWGGLLVLLALGSSPHTMASPYIDPGDRGLRHDIQRLADRGIIRGPITTWPLAWGPVLEDLKEADVAELPPALADSVMRLRHRGGIETRTEVLGFQAEIGAARDPRKIRSFQDTPRGDLELSAGAEWMGDWFSAEVNVQYVDGDPEVDEYRADGSMIGVALGNWSISANTLERWWGPGWDGSLILSNNARPIPSITLDRIFTDAFETRWLSWLGPWDISVTFGQLESDRVVQDARFFGMRFSFRPLDSLEIALSRSAQWCGKARPCDAETFYNLLIGKDNRGDPGVTSDNEPGNQMAGVDFRWSPGWFGHALGFYGQFIGEDEAGGFPSRYLGLVGGEWSGYLFDSWSAHVFAEFAGTTCQFHETSEIFNCAYNHGTYETGYRYRGRAIGHGADNDARVVSIGGMLLDTNVSEWHVLLRQGTLNRGGAADPRHSITALPLKIGSVDVSYRRAVVFGTLELGAGYERIEEDASSSSTSDARFYLQWRHQF